MPIECRPSNLSSDVRCPSCGQGFLLYGDDRIARQHAVRATVQQELRRQHEQHDHARDGFTLNVVPDSSAVFAC